GLERTQVLSLAESHWVDAHHGIVIVGATGPGKTYVACALATAAIRRGHTALYLRGPRLLDDIAIARPEGRLAQLLNPQGSRRRPTELRLPDQSSPARPCCRRAGCDRGPGPAARHHRDQPAPRRPVARTPRRAHRRRRHPRPAPRQRAPHRTPRRVHAPWSHRRQRHPDIGEPATAIEPSPLRPKLSDSQLNDTKEVSIRG